MMRAIPILSSATLLLVLLLGALGSTSNAFGFSKNQNPVIAIGQWESPSYGTLYPQGGLAFDSSGTLWVADSYNNRVLGFAAPFSSNMSATYVIGQLEFHGQASGIASNRIGRPSGVTVDSKDNLWVADPDNNRILAFERPFHNGMDASIAIGQFDLSSREENTTRNTMAWPNWSAFDASGNLWVADDGNSRVLEFRPPLSTGMNASLEIGEPDFNHKYCEKSMFNIDSRCSNHSTMAYPSQIAFDPHGDLWVLEGITPTGRFLEYKPPFTNAMSATLVMGPVYPSALAFDSDGNLWLGCINCGFAGGGRVLEYGPPFNEHSVVWENGVAKNQNFTLGEHGDKWDWNNVMVPMGLGFDSAGNLWVVDFRDYWVLPGIIGRILAFDAQTHEVNTATGPVLIVNYDGLLLPLSWITTTKTDGPAFPEGLFNFTIQGLQPGGSAELTITFPHTLPDGIGWWVREDNEWNRLPTDQFSVAGKNMTLTLKNASSNGAISVFGGPGFQIRNATTTASQETSTSAQGAGPIGSYTSLIVISVLVAAIIAGSVYAIKKRISRKH